LMGDESMPAGSFSHIVASFTYLFPVILGFRAASLCGNGWGGRVDGEM